MALQGHRVDFFHHGAGRGQGTGWNQSVPLNPYPMTWIWNVYVDTAVPANEYATFFAMGPDSFSGGNYYTAAIVDGGHGANTLSVGANGQDGVGSVTSAPVGRWMRQALICYRQDGNTHHDFYWDLPVFSRVLTKDVTGTSYFANTSSATFFRFGDVAWASNESLHGRFQNMKAFQAKLTPAAAFRESTSGYPQLAQYAPSLYGCWPASLPANYASSDDEGFITQDISGNNRNLYTPNPGTPMTMVANGPSIHKGVGVPRFDYSPELLVSAPVTATGPRFWPFGQSL